MDSGTHLVMGIGLAGLASIDPAVASDQTLYAAVLIGTVVGSQAPDLDGLLRFKSNAAYIRNHRGVSHSIPAVAIWTIAISLLLETIFRFRLPWLHLGGWVLLAVCVHVFTDLFNTYGTQAARPFTQKWISWNIIHIFDPVIFVSHLLAIALWALGIGHPTVIFPLLYACLIVYYIWRTVTHRTLRNRLSRLDSGFKEGDEFILIPTISLFDWNVVKRRPDGYFFIGDFRQGKLRWIDSAKCKEHPAIDRSRNDPSIRAFLYFTSFACADVLEHPWGYEVRWSDVRYRHRKQYPFVGVLVMDHEFKTLGSYVGWLSDERLQKRLRMNTY
ncbi:metal-dependent hydrolase [Paenibacillus sacheonensis]|uniref:Metal-dependent hydrolase n=1 Tax=Paenibacillus sacheonensis TaxID=742054 RepID=A0A7X4YNY3_9BACL|nr:metal-dependent hydrolase [Paenibacillus sacheonensis]MBM7567411.1 inner membrane protein [Paenibacillus sacheonensis]NBC69807.1 metal-dependent hydrolase [Paenibacillus sacheonensis]